MINYFLLFFNRPDCEVRTIIFNMDKLFFRTVININRKYFITNMTVKDYITTTDYISRRRLFEQVQNLGRSDNPLGTLSALRRELASLEIQWNDFVDHMIYNGRRIKKMMITSAMNTTLDGFLNRVCGYMPEYKGKDLWLRYDRKIYSELCHMETAMLLWKYENGLTEQELYIALVFVLVKYFSICTERVDGKNSIWLYKAGDFEMIYNEILSTPCGALSDYFNQIQYDYMPVVRTSAYSSEKEYFQELLDSGATKAELIREAMRVFKCKRRTAYTKLKKLGLTRPYNYKEK